MIFITYNVVMGGPHRRVLHSVIIDQRDNVSRLVSVYILQVIKMALSIFRVISHRTTLLTYEQVLEHLDIAVRALQYSYFALRVVVNPDQ